MQQRRADAVPRGVIVSNAVKPIDLLLELRQADVRLAPRQKVSSFLSAFPASVPSLSWQIFGTQRKQCLVLT